MTGAAMLSIGILAWSLLLPAALLVRIGSSAGPAIPQFPVLGLTFFACCAAHSGPVFHMVSYAIFCGVAPMAAVSVYSVEGLAGLGGRLLLGLLGGCFGAKTGTDCRAPFFV